MALKQDVSIRAYIEQALGREEAAYQRTLAEMSAPNAIFQYRAGEAVEDVLSHAARYWVARAVLPAVLGTERDGGDEAAQREAAIEAALEVARTSRSQMSGGEFGFRAVEESRRVAATLFVDLLVGRYTDRWEHR